MSFDMEGISAVTSWREMKKDSKDLQRVRKIATREVNAAVRGVQKSGMNIGAITICDSHASGENLLVDELESGVNIVKGTPRKYYMMHGISAEYDIAFFIGYHAMAGTRSAGMEHTYSSSTIYNIRINGQLVGESEINAALAGYYNVPLGLVTGDDLLTAEIRRFFGRNVETVITKKGISRFAAQCRHPEDVQREIERKAKRSIQKGKRLKAFKFRSPIRADIDLASTTVADLVELIPGVKRTAGRTIKFRTGNILEFYHILRLVCTLGIYANTTL